tara:strand:+ start:9107 stop:9283 length:177 start_codon:yes stop_codon:yes gene_type:complete
MGQKIPSNDLNQDHLYKSGRFDLVSNSRIPFLVLKHIQQLRVKHKLKEAESIVKEWFL